MFEKLKTPMTQNLEQEQHTLQEVKQGTQQLARQQFAQAA